MKKRLIMGNCKHELALACLIVVAVAVLILFFTENANKAVGEENHLEEDYEWAIAYTKVLAIMNEELYQNKNLEMMVLFHEKLSNSTGLYYSKYDLFDNFFKSYHEIVTSSEPLAPLDQLKKYWIENILRDSWRLEKKWDENVMTTEGMVLPRIEIQDHWFVPHAPAN